MKLVNCCDFLKFFGIMLIGMILGGVVLCVQVQEYLSEEDVIVKVLKYIYKFIVEGLKCVNCMYIQGDVGVEWCLCVIFLGK